MPKWLSIGMAACAVACKPDPVIVQSDLVFPGSPMEGPQLAVGPFHACLLDLDGKSVCWGENIYGQSRIPEGKGDGLLQIAAGVRSTCGVTRAKEVSCWGSPSEHPPRPVQGAVRVGVGEDFGCAVLVDGKIHCWGAGNGGGRREPPAVAEGFRDLSLGNGFGCAVTRSNELRCWGEKENVESLPRQGIRTVVAGPRSACVLREDGKAACGKALPTFNDVQGVIQIAVAEDFACVLLTDRSVICRSVPHEGKEHQAREFRIDARAGTSAIAAFSPLGLPKEQVNFCTLDGSGTEHCWTIWLEEMTLTFVSPSVRMFTGAKGFVSGLDNACSMGERGLLGCWGSNGNRQADPPAETFAASVAAMGNSHGCASLAQGTAKCWGRTDFKTSPVGAPALVQLAAAADTTCGITAPKGEVYCFGYGIPGTFVGGGQRLGGASFLVASSHAYCAVLNSGAVKCWRNGTDGLGSVLSTPFDGTSPATRAVSVSPWYADPKGDEQHACAVSKEGRLTCWALLTGELETPPPGLENVSDAEEVVAAPFFGIEDAFACIRTRSGKVRCSATAEPNSSIIERIEGARQLYNDGALYSICAATQSGEVICWDIDKYHNFHFSPRR